MTSGKSVTEQLEGRCVIGRAPSGHEDDEQLAASNRPSGTDVIRLVCFRWIKAPSAHWHPIAKLCDVGRGGGGAVVLVEMDVARTKTHRV